MRWLSLLVLALAGCGPSVQAPEREVRTTTVQAPASPEQPEAATEPVEVPGGESCDGARDPTREANLREAEIAIRCLTNAARRGEGLDALGFDERLARAAATRSSDMVEQRYFAHRGPDGGNVERAAKRAGYVPDRGSYLLGENIGWAGEGRATPAQMMRGWLDSPTHRENILSPDFTEMGVGAIAGVPDADADPGATYTQLFGAKGRAAREAQTR